MSRVLVAPKSSAPGNKPSKTPDYKVFIWDLGTDHKEPHKASVRTMAILEYSSPLHQIVHFSTAVRPIHVRTKRRTPTFSEAWDDMTDFILNHSEGKPPLLVSHNAAFDVTVLLREVRRNRIKIPSSWRFACSLLFARSVYGVTDNSQLALAAKFGITVSRPHDTSEDVLVLRHILRSLDDKAARDGDQRVILFMCSHAHTPYFFDRTPQYDSESDSPGAEMIFITNTGIKYHRGDCQWVQRSKIPRNTPPPGVKPCTVCRPDPRRQVKEKLRTSSDRRRGRRVNINIQRQASSSATSSPSSPRSQFFVTAHGKKYHVDGCRYLSKSKFPVDSPPPNCKPCGTCIQDRRPNSRSQLEVGNVAQSSMNPSSDETPYFVTRKGDKFHKKGCTALRNSSFPKSVKHVGYDPCATCLPDLAYLGTPKLRTYRNL